MDRCIIKRLNFGLDSGLYRIRLPFSVKREKRELKSGEKKRFEVKEHFQIREGTVVLKGTTSTSVFSKNI